jgi:hypothetical protein
MWPFLNGLEVCDQVCDARRHLAARFVALRIFPDLVTPYRHVAQTMGGNVGAAVDEAGYLVFWKRVSISQ